ncbi:hypothetical protein T01_10129 [Trichinella spiralis]|uniref:Uncharacterized protein n=1 Tax=Trichinella spiralis TaxID=6334 RepID=A0A0V1AM90_TRISP|nr:hypothetical protein T01_14671 [Trichinella spiralis]KRY27504.1 hypothetical protein T01_10129 [Trichinella spiralis]
MRSKCAYHQRHLIVYILTEFQKLSNKDEIIVSAMRIAFTFNTVTFYVVRGWKHCVLFGKSTEDQL